MALVDQQCFHGVASRRIIALGVPDDFEGLTQIGLFIDVNVTDALGVTEYRYMLRLFLDGTNEFGATARYNEIDVLLHRQ